jgi:N-formylglutamate amidohydrolase
LKILIYLCILLLSGCYNVTYINPSIQLIKGTLPILITIPHDGTKVLNYTPIRNDSSVNFNIKNDLNTKEIGLEIANQLFSLTGEFPTVIINNIHRKYLDLNRESNLAYSTTRTKIIYNNYHNIIEKEVNRILINNKSVLLLDLHGFLSDTIDISLSTRNHKTLFNKNELEIIFNSSSGIYKTLLNNNFITKVNYPFYGGYTIKTISSKFNRELSAIQIELGNKIRFDMKEKEKFIKLISKSLIFYIKIKEKTLN